MKRLIKFVLAVTIVLAADIYLFRRWLGDDFTWSVALLPAVSGILSGALFYLRAYSEDEACTVRRLSSAQNGAAGAVVLSGLSWLALHNRMSKPPGLFDYNLEPLVVVFGLIALSVIAAIVGFVFGLGFGQSNRGW